MAKDKSESMKRQVSAYLTTYRHVKPSLTGRDLQAMGLKPGPLYRNILDALLAARLNGEVNTEAEERELAKRLAGCS
jgi:tRNA nucleotidyltransferase (CCA-adding enzyme)